MSEEAKKEPKRLSTIETPPEPERFSTMIAGLDQCLAEYDDGPQGLAPGTSILLSGMPGGGKSTIATYMSAAQTGRESLIGLGEERPARTKERWNRLGLKDADPYIVSLTSGEDFLEVIRDINAIPSGKGLGMVVVDSVQTLRWGGKRKYDAQLEACEMIVGQVVAAGGCVILVSHVDKSGASHQGAASLAHLVDIHLHLTANAKKAERSLEVRKNRIGRAGFQVPLNVLQNGLSVGVPAPISMTGGLGQARNALERARDIAYEMLLKGERVDGYTVFGLPPEAGVTNGGMWRAGVEMATKMAVRDGYSVIEEKVNGRKGFRLENPPNKDVPVVTTKKVTLDGATNKLVDAKAPPQPEAKDEPLPIELD